VEGGKRIVAVAGLVGLLVVIAGAIVFIVKAQWGEQPVPERIKSQETRKIDVKTHQIMIKPLIEWNRLGQKGARYKNPETGEFTMATAIKCWSCREWIPSMPAGGGGPPKVAGVLEQVQAGYVCPLCKERVYEMPTHGRVGTD
jgi:hypothetical protein